MDDILSKVYKAGLKFLAPLSPEETYDTIIRESLKISAGQYGSIFLEQDGELKRVRASDEDLTIIKPRPLGYTYRTFKTGRPHLITSDELEKIHPTSRKFGIKTTVFIPLSYKNHTVGVLSIHRTSQENFDKKQLKALELFGSYISLAIRQTQLNSELTETLKSRDLFMAMAAHELRTPLTSVSGYVQLLYNRFASQETVEANWVKELYGESIRLNKLAKELLEINQVRTGKLSFFWAEYNFIEIINRAISALRFSSSNRNILFRNHTHQNQNVIIGDFDKLIQVITNILENAVKHSPDDSLIEVVLVEQKKYYTLSVIDKGSGIPKKDIRKIGQEFYKGENSRDEGMGLGLYIANYIISHHKGLLRFKSAVNKGTKVIISIPKILNDARN